MTYTGRKVENIVRSRPSVYERVTIIRKDFGRGSLWGMESYPSEADLMQLHHAYEGESERRTLESLTGIQKPERSPRWARAQSFGRMRASDKASEQDSAGGLFDHGNHYGAMASGI